MSWLLFTPIILITSFIFYMFYMFVIKIYLDAYKFKRMDPNLKVLIAPFTGLQGVQKYNI